VLCVGKIAFFGKGLDGAVGCGDLERCAMWVGF